MIAAAREALKGARRARPWRLDGRRGFEMSLGSRFRMRCLRRPGEHLDDEALRRLFHDVRLVTRNSILAVPKYGVFLKERGPYENRIVTLIYDWRGEIPVAMSAMVEIPFVLGGREELLCHLGTIMVDDRYWRLGFQSALYGAPNAYLCLLRGLRGFWVSNVSQIPAIVGAVADNFHDVYPDYAERRPRKVEHLLVARTLLAGHRHEMGIGEEAVFDEERFVVETSYTGGSDVLQKPLVGCMPYKDERCNRFCEERLDYERGDDLVQVGRVEAHLIPSVAERRLAALRRRLARSAEGRRRTTRIAPPKTIGDLLAPHVLRSLEMPELAPDIRIRPYRSEDDEKLVDLAESTFIDAAQSLVVDRSPSHERLNDTLGPRWETFVAETSDERVVGFLDAIHDERLVDDEPIPVTYFPFIGVHPDYRGGTVTLMLAFEGYMAASRAGARAAFYVVNEENARSIRRIMHPNNVFRPSVYWDFSLRYLLTLPALRPGPSGHRYRQAREGDIPSVARCLAEHGRGRLLAPRFDAGALRALFAADNGLGLDDLWLAEDDSGRVVATAAFWDQSSFRKVRVKRYAPTNAALVRAWNGVMPRLGMPRYPVEGEQQRVVHAHLVSYRGGEAAAAGGLLRHVVPTLRRKGILLVGVALCHGDPLGRHLAGLAHTKSSMVYFLNLYDKALAESEDILAAARPHVSFATL